MILQQQKKATILCALCGSKFIPENGNICDACTLANLEDEVSLTANEEVVYCTYCHRFERPPWILCERESQEMMSMLLKKVKGLNKVTFKSAKFIWTEPHSKRMKLKIDIEKEVSEKVKIQQSQIVQFVERYSQCNDCRKMFTPHDWNTVIQLRQHTEHKKTILNLEQNLLKQKFQEKVLKIEEADDGIDFFFKSEHDAVFYLNYIKSHLPVLIKSSKQLISVNQRDNTSHVKTTYSLTIPKVCRDDLVKVPYKLYKKLGNCSCLLLCLKVTSVLHFMDITTHKKIELTAAEYFTHEPLMEIYTLKNYGKQFTIMDNEGQRNPYANNMLATWGLVTSQINHNNQFKENYVKSHLNLDTGTDVLGYNLEENQEWKDIKNVPAFLLVKKIKNQEEKLKKKNKRKNKRKNDKSELESKESQLQDSINETNMNNKKQWSENQEGKVDKNEEDEEEWIDADDDQN